MKNIMTGLEIANSIYEEGRYDQCLCKSLEEHKEVCSPNLKKQWLSKEFVEKCIDNFFVKKSCHCNERPLDRVWCDYCEAEKLKLILKIYNKEM